ncbi:hypothetical protein FQA47_003772 [Oryzias melastigma]|uniref:Uncharacterized protein n=1 Tax=Oryzias melastigma TaxID=30732 RepID=A0A834CCT8_ORYME|nr:hypothetical protein FQA47_003772 [Oryzias melastigma]
MSVCVVKQQTSDFRRFQTRLMIRAAARARCWRRSGNGHRGGAAPLHSDVPPPPPHTHTPFLKGDHETVCDWLKPCGLPLWSIDLLGVSCRADSTTSLQSSRSGDVQMVEATGSN